MKQSVTIEKVFRSINTKRKLVMVLNYVQPSKILYHILKVFNLFKYILLMF